MSLTNICRTLAHWSLENAPFDIDDEGSFEAWFTLIAAADEATLELERCEMARHFNATILRSDGMRFESMNAAGKALGEINGANIDKYFRGKRNHVKGYTFQRIEEESV